VVNGGRGLPLDRDKLAKILGLLSSDKTGEILSAAQAAVALTRTANTSWAEVLSAGNDNLRNTVRQLAVENNTLRRELARHRNSAPRTQRVALVAAGIGLALGIVASLALQDVVMLAGSSVRSGTMASPGQKASEAAARSSELPTAERRGSISEQQSSVVMVTPDARPEPPASDDALAPVEDMTTQPATLPPAIAAPGQSAQTPEAPPPVTSSVSAEEQAALPPTSLTTSPSPTQSSPNQRLSAAETAALVTRGDDFLSAGDIVSARLFYERAADAGDRGAALRLSAIFDPAFLSWTGVRGTPDDPPQASSWYRRAVDLGNPAAQEHPQNLEQQGVPEPGSPPH